MINSYLLSYTEPLKEIWYYLDTAKEDRSILGQFMEDWVTYRAALIAHAIRYYEIRWRCRN